MGTYHSNPSMIYASQGVEADCVASVYGIWTNTDFDTADKDKKCEVGMANARLICAAPELLHALKELLAMHYCGTEHADGCGCASCLARSVIRKADGAKQ